MKKSELINLVAERIDLNKSKADAVVSEFIAQITNALAREESVNLLGFGRFEVRSRASREGRNPATGQPITIAASKTVGFKPGKTLKDTLNT